MHSKPNAAPGWRRAIFLAVMKAIAQKNDVESDTCRAALAGSSVCRAHAIRSPPERSRSTTARGRMAAAEAGCHDKSTSIGAAVPR
jgi:hypothetical protein